MPGRGQSGRSGVVPRIPRKISRPGRFRSRICCTAVQMAPRIHCRISALLDCPYRTSSSASAPPEQASKPLLSPGVRKRHGKVQRATWSCLAGFDQGLQIIDGGRSASPQPFDHPSRILTRRVSCFRIGKPFGAYAFQFRGIVDYASAGAFDERVANLALVFIMWPEKHRDLHCRRLCQVLSATRWCHAAADERDRRALIERTQLAHRVEKKNLGTCRIGGGVCRQRTCPDVTEVCGIKFERDFRDAFEMARRDHQREPREALDEMSVCRQHHSLLAGSCRARDQYRAFAREILERGAQICRYDLDVELGVASDADQLARCSETHVTAGVFGGLHEDEVGEGECACEERPREPVASHRTLRETPVDDRYFCLGTSRLAEKIGPKLGLRNQHEVGAKVAEKRAHGRGAIERCEQMMRGGGK